jgi:hypothetical protein
VALLDVRSRDRSTATLTGSERANFEQVMLGRCQVDDLLGDIDGAVMATMPRDEPLSAG